uniref:CUB domain-containing protein n=1 Tax=Panagrolaimus sp. ES5 TaxID=591445 RepID=A0AC34F8Y8_9BILA
MYSAIQGSAIFDSWGFGCPLESVARINPFHFQDEKQILKVQSVWTEDSKRSHPCIWQFSAPKGYGFKITLENLHLSDSTNLRIDNSNETFLSKAAAKLGKTYYTEDNYLKISLSYDPLSPSGVIEFLTYVMIVKIDWVQVEANCEVKKEETSAEIWSGKSFPNNAKCGYNYIIAPKTETIASYWIYLEEEIDVLNLYFDGNDSIPYPLNIIGTIAPPIFSIYPFEDETERSVYFEFISDGN